MRSAVGPEPRSNAEPTALGVVVEFEGLVRRLDGWLSRTSPDRYLRSLPAWRMTFAALGETVTGVVEAELELEPVSPPLVCLGLELLGFPPPPDGRHSL